MLRPTDVLFGEIAVALKLLTRAQLDECIELQQRGRRRFRLGAICEDRGYLTHREVTQILAQQNRLLEHRAAANRPGR